MGVFQSFKRLTAKSFGVLSYVVQYGCIAHCTFEYVADIVVCSGSSMEPTLHTNNILLTEHISPRLQKFTRGDIIVALSPTDPRQYICKRVTGIPGDKMRMGFLQQIVIVVPPGHVWLEGDNHGNSTDSRSYGPVPQGLIRGRAVCRMWPFQDVCMFNSSDSKES